MDVAAKKLRCEFATRLWCAGAVKEEEFVNAPCLLCCTVIVWCLLRSDVGTVNVSVSGQILVSEAFTTEGCERVRRLLVL